jgi:hypothetical protein
VVVVSVPGYRSRGATRFPEVVGLERGPLSLKSTIESYLEENVVAPAYKAENTAIGDPLRWPRGTPLSAEVGSNLADKRQSLVDIVRSQTQATKFSFFF